MIFRKSIRRPVPPMLAILFLSLILISRAWAQSSSPVDPLSAARISLAAMQNVLAAPPLPTLRTKEGRSVTFQGGYSTGSVRTEENSFYEGKLQGGSLGIGYTGRAEKGFAYFGTLFANDLQGSMVLHAGGNNNADIHFNNMSVQGFAGMGGGSWRVLGENDSFAALGIFVGPMIAKFMSKSDISGTNYQDSFGASPLLWGGLAGLQLEFRPGPFMVKPYTFFFNDFSNECKAYEGAGGGDSTCPTGSLPLRGSFAAYGLNVGYKGFKVNAVSQVFNDQSLATFEVHNYQLSYTKGFD